MKINYITSIALILFAFGCSKKMTPQNSIGSVPDLQHVSVGTQHNDNYRSGWNSNETQLDTGNVNTAHFGKLFTLNVDDQVYAQPLVAANISIGGAKHNVVYVATVNNSVYAYDGDNGNLYWQKNFTQAGMRPPRNTDMTGACGGAYEDFSGNIGIVGTPVIDTNAQIIYFVARSTDGTNYVQYLHAVNILTGSEMSGSPVKISPVYPGTGDGSVGGVISFDGQRQNQRQALILLNGIVYITWSSHCDWGPYHGWIVGYNANNLQPQVVYNDTPDGGDGGIWESGMGMAADNAGNLYAAIGNGTVGLNGDPTNVINRGESAIKLTLVGSTLSVSSYFTPYNYASLNANDQDFGSLGCLLIPNSNYFLTGCKDGNLYLLNKDNMGGYLPSGNQVQQTVSLNNSNAQEHSQAAYYNSPAGEYIYVWSENDVLRAYPFNRGTNTLDAGNMVQSSVSGPTGGNGAVLAVSSNGSIGGTGILWASFAIPGNDAGHSVSPGILYAFDAGNITKTLWSSSIVPGDAVGYYAKFATPTIADCHVYLATFSNAVDVYGLK